MFVWVILTFPCIGILVPIKQTKNVGTYITKINVSTYITKKDVSTYITKIDVGTYITKKDVGTYVPKKDVSTYITKIKYQYLYKKKKSVPI